MINFVIKPILFLGLPCGVPMYSRDKESGGWKIVMSNSVGVRMMYNGWINHQIML